MMVNVMVMDNKTEHLSEVIDSLNRKLFQVRQDLDFSYQENARLRGRVTLLQQQQSKRPKLEWD